MRNIFIKGVCALVFISSLFIADLMGQKTNSELASFAQKVNGGSEIAFVFSATDNKGKEIYNEKGTTIIKGDKYRMEMPGDLLVINNGTTRWIYKEGEEELVIAANNPNEDDILENPFAVLRVENGAKLKNYAVSVIKRGATSGDLSGVPDKIILTANGGAKYTIKITGFKLIQNISGDKFELDLKKYPNAVVTDLR